MRLLLALFCAAILSNEAMALPAFARRENAPCTMCHLNGSAPHLNKIGYLYRRAGFRFPAEIGNEERDLKNADVTKHMSVQARFSYELADQKPIDGNTTQTANNFDVPSVNVFPLVGAFLGNYSAWTEIEAVPASHDDAGVNLTEADLRYVLGNKDMWFNFRGGLVGYQGYGLGDRGLLGGGDIPLMNSLSGSYNQDTLATPFGDFEQYGAELGFNYADSHLTLSLLNGMDGSTLNPAGDPVLTPALMNKQSKTHKDVKVQLDQFVGNDFEGTIVYYNGMIPLLDPSKTVTWKDTFDAYRLYLTYSGLQRFQVELGGGTGTYHYVEPGSSTVAGKEQSSGYSAAVLFFVPHVTLEARGDSFQYSKDKKAQGYEAVASLPFDNSLILLSYNHVKSDLAGVSNQTTAEWKFVF